MQVSHSNYDTHNENFDFHIEQLGEFDRPFATFVADLADRGLLESTLIVVFSSLAARRVISPFGSRPLVESVANCWPAENAARGCIGKTNEDGTAVEDGQVDHGALFHTYLEAVGVDSTGSFVIDGRKMPIADPAAKVIKPILT